MFGIYFFTLANHSFINVLSGGQYVYRCAYVNLIYIKKNTSLALLWSVKLLLLFQVICH